MLNWSNWKILFQIPKRWNIISPWSLVNMKMGSTLEHTHILIVTNRFWRMYYWRKVQKKPGDWIVILSTLNFLLQKSITLGNEKKSSHEILRECVDVHLSFVKSWNSKYENWSANHTITKKKYHRNYLDKISSCVGVLPLPYRFEQN